MCTSLVYQLRKSRPINLNMQEFKRGKALLRNTQTLSARMTTLLLLLSLLFKKEPWIFRHFSDYTCDA